MEEGLAMPSSLQRALTWVLGSLSSSVQAELGGCDFGAATAFASSGSSGGETGFGALGNQFSLELGESREDAEKTMRPAAVVVSMLAPWPVRTFKADAAGVEVTGDLDDGGGCDRGDRASRTSVSPLREGLDAGGR